MLHTHTVAGVAVSCQKQGLLPLNQWSLQFTDRLAYHDYEGIALDLDERARLVADLGDKFVMVLRNHGMLTCGRSVAEAFKLMHNLERSCRAQLAVQASGAEIIALSAAVARKTAGQYASFYDSDRNQGVAGQRMGRLQADAGADRSGFRELTDVNAPARNAPISADQTRDMSCSSEF